MTITTCIFDAYGTLFDVSAAAQQAAGQPGREPLAALWPALAEDWRRKQLEYSWLRAITGQHVDFWQLTGDALDWALEHHGLTEPVLREDLLGLYWQLSAYPEVPGVLAGLIAGGRRCGILSNGAPGMLDAAVQSAGLAGLLDAVISVEEVGIFKPASRVYDLVGRHFGTRPQEVLFVSSNGWDAAGAASYGFTTAWVNRAGLPRDRLPGQPAHELPDLSSLAEIL